MFGLNSDKTFKYHSSILIINKLTKLDEFKNRGKMIVGVS